MKRVKNLILILIIPALLVAAAGYYHLFYPNTADNIEAGYFFIEPDASYFDVINSLDTLGFIKSRTTLDRVARRKGYDKRIIAGKYVIPSGIGNNKLINLLRSGSQVPVAVTIINYRTINEMAGKVATYINADSTSIVDFFNDESNYKNDGFDRETIIGMILPDTYEFRWNTTAKGFYTRMLREYNIFWTEQKRKVADSLGLTLNEVSILASIIDDEVLKEDEKPRIAGVYLNRLKSGIPLQACPTIRFALNDFTIKRVLTEHLKVDSPYNTYKIRGFPPGPIRIASKSGILAVLKAENHSYYYFVARSDFSGYHHFSRTLAEHNRYAAEYQRELNKLRIYR